MVTVMFVVTRMVTTRKKNQNIKTINAINIMMTGVSDMIKVVMAVRTAD